jgi:hypothetical protein
VLVHLSPSGKPIGILGSTKHLLPVGDTASLPDRSLYEGFIPLATPENLVSVFYCDNTAEPNRDYYYLLVAVDSSLLVSPPSDEIHIATAVGVSISAPESAEPLIVEQNYPNPFNATTAIVYSLPNIGAQPAPVRLAVYNLLGQQIKSLIDERQQPGRHIVYWDGTDQQGRPVASGVYFYRLEVSGIEFVRSGKMILMK